MGKYGCLVSKFGQAQLSPDAREYLHNGPGADDRLIRWLPDLFVISPPMYNAGFSEYMWLVDSKYSFKYNPDFPSRYAHWLIEKAVLSAQRELRKVLGLPIVYIWPDGLTCSYVEDLTDDLLITAPYYGEGSGTEAWKFPRNKTCSLDDVFGKGVA
jgi:hypothetical protein